MLTEEQNTDLLPVEAPKDDESAGLLEELLPRLDEDDESRLVRQIHSDYRAALLDRQDWEAGLDGDLRMYHGIQPRKDFPWPGCANFHVPVTMTCVETLKPRLVQSIVGGDPVVFAKPIGGEDTERRERVELFLNWQAQNELELEPLVEESAHRFLLPGTVVAKVFWDTNVRRVKVLRRFPVGTEVPSMLRSLFGPVDPDKFEAVDADTYEGTFSIPGKPERDIRVKFRTTQKEVLALVEKDEVLFDGPRVEMLEAEDLIVPTNGGGNVNKLPFVIHRQWLNENTLRLMVAQGRLYADAVEDLLKSGAEGAETNDAQEAKETRAAIEGVIADGESDVRQSQYEILQDYRAYDIDDDGFEEEIITWTCPDLEGKLLGWDYLDNVVGHGRRPFVVGRYLAEPGRFYGLSLPKVVRGIQDEINTMHNQRVDAGTLKNSMTYFFRASSSHDGTNAVTIGQGTPIDNPSTDILIPQWGADTSWGQAEEALLYQYLERLVGISDLALGRQPNRVGATRTAAGTASLLGEANLRFQTSMRAFQRFWSEIFRHILALDQQYLAPGKEFRVTGRKPEIIRIDDRDELVGNYDLTISATTETMNRQVMREDAAVKLNAAMNPMALQTGIVGRKGLYRLMRGFYRAYGEPDPDLILEPQMQSVVLMPAQELAVWVSGGDVDPTPFENLQAHLVEHTAQRSDPMVRRLLGPDGMKKLEKHMSDTVQLLQMQALGTQQQAGRANQQGGGGSPAVAGPQAMNAETGRTAPQQQPTASTRMPQPGKEGGGA